VEAGGCGSTLEMLPPPLSLFALPFFSI